MSKRRVVLYVIALATTVTLVLALLNRSQLAIAALAIALVAMFGWVVLWARALNARVARSVPISSDRGDGTSDRLPTLGIPSVRSTSVSAPLSSTWPAVRNRRAASVLVMPST